MKYAFCLEMLFADRPFPDRLFAAARAGIAEIEIWDWRNKDLDTLKVLLERLGLRISNMSGNRRFGMLARTEFDGFVEEARETAAIAMQLNCPRLMLLAQALESDDSARPLAGKISHAELMVHAVQAGRATAQIAEEKNLMIVIEPLNDVQDHPGFLMNSSDVAFEMVAEIASPRVKVLYDVYHMAMMGEDVEDVIRKNIDMIGYVHFADVPGRHEPGSGSLNLISIVETLQQAGYDGTVGFEFTPSNGDSDAAIQKTMQLLAG